MFNGNNTTDGWVLEKNCRPEWPRWTCLTANVCGLCSTAIWFIVLLPQVWKNFRRRSVRGLSVLWASANFTASLINLFFVFLYVKVPLYSQISAVYSPVLELALLVQFLLYGTQSRKEKVIFAAGCLLLWGAVVTIEIVFHLEDFVEYAAITLWSIETFPQVILNMRLQSTSGQATSSVAIAMVGKTTDFLATNGLVMPLQYVIMRYFSTSVAYVNGIQVAYYYGNDFVEQDRKLKSENGIDSLKARYVNEMPNTEMKMAKEVKNVLDRTDKLRCNTFENCARVTCICIFVVLLAGCVVGFCLNLDSFYGLFGPIFICSVLLAAKCYIFHCNSKSYEVRNLLN
ncbi:CTNS-like protein [Mya arenaria]|uniref:CTNS-like protein n=1 Tax=Mya arenaria TaxID=6604 RepID=A0ABY7F1C3_MYAAR|nr:uncharacterized protein LOC128202716 [Mya arenaria]WAR14866.1 CTNS-like protein [Mya arenaria]